MNGVAITVRPAVQAGSKASISFQKSNFVETRIHVRYARKDLQLLRQLQNL